VAGFGLVGKPEICAFGFTRVQAALLVLPFCFVTFVLGKQNKSKDG